MPHASESAAVGLALSLGVVAVAGLLGARQWYERRHRETGLSRADARHFGLQDVRRWTGAAVMALLALGIAVGSRVPPRAAGRTNQVFVRTWLGVFLLVFVLLGLALSDWLATRLYARRHRRRLTQEGIAILRDEARRRAYRANGRPRRLPSGDEPSPPE